VHISVPEINIWLGEKGDINVSRVNRESPGRMLVAELMIMANWLTARFLAAHGLAAVFRSQPDPRERLYRGEEGTLFQNWMQRRLINRFVLGRAAEKHSGLGLSAYVTATSPIRKYFDLVTQRQVRAALGLEDPYSPDEIDQIIQLLEFPMSRVFKLQTSRHRYWLLKHLEQRVGQKLEAIALVRRRHHYQLLLVDYMLECDLPITGFLDLKPEDLVQVTIQKADARKDLVALTIG
jgi:exoribonuclease-2